MEISLAPILSTQKSIDLNLKSNPNFDFSFTYDLIQARIFEFNLYSNWK